MRNLLGLLLILLCLATLIQPALAGAKKPTPMMTLEETFRAWHRGFSSDKKEDWEKTFRSMVPTKKDLQHLFPMHADKMWPYAEKDFEEKLKALLKSGPKEIIGMGAIKKIELIDVRKEEEPRKKFAKALQIIPADVPVFQLRIEYERGTRDFGDATACLQVNGRWFYIPEFAEFSQESLDSLK